MPEWLQCVKEISKEFNMDPNEMLAVAEAEGSKHGYRWWFGKVKCYYLPWGVHDYVVAKHGWPVWNWRMQTWVAIRALALFKHKTGNLTGALRIYNKACTPDYLKQVYSLARQNRRQRVFD